MHRILKNLAIGAALAILGVASPAHAQFGDWLKDVVKDVAKSEGRHQVNRLLRNAIRCAVGEYDCYEKAKKDGKEVVFVDEDGEVITDSEGNPITDPSKLPPEHRQQATGTASAGPGAASASYTFEPGEQTLLATDFSGNSAGDFPRELRYLSGNMQLVDWQGRKWLRVESQASLEIPLDATLPEQFTIEFTIMDRITSSGTSLVMAPLPGERRDCWGYQGAFLNVGSWRGTGVWLDGKPLSVGELDRIEEEPHRIEIMVDGSHVRLYANKNLVANVPQIELGRNDAIRFCIYAKSDPESHIYLTDIRVAGGGKDLYDALTTEGRVAVHDILFDTDKATIKPESAESLATIATMLTEHPDLSLMIEGHTDSSGDFDHNMELSKQRAAAVKQWLVTKHGIGADRLRTMGLGSTQPQASNDTPEGMAQNRRVELVRVDG